MWRYSATLTHKALQTQLGIEKKSNLRTRAEAPQICFQVTSSKERAQFTTIERTLKTSGSKIRNLSIYEQSIGRPQKRACIDSMQLNAETSREGQC